jgi:hypothetical protein
VGGPLQELSALLSEEVMVEEAVEGCRMRSFGSSCLHLSVLAT